MAPLVLIVEDDPNSSYLFKAILKRGGYQSISAANGNEAISLLQEQTPDVILLDLGLPGTNGLEVLRFIRQAAHLARTKIIIVSAYLDLMYKVHESDADALITKPVGAMDLLQTIAEVLAR